MGSRTVTPLEATAIGAVAGVFEVLIMQVRQCFPSQVGVLARHLCALYATNDCKRERIDL